VAGQAQECPGGGDVAEKIMMRKEARHTLIATHAHTSQRAGARKRTSPRGCSTAFATGALAGNRDVEHGWPSGWRRREAYGAIETRTRGRVTLRVVGTRGAEV
jgi:hypothetical protein